MTFQRYIVQHELSCQSKRLYSHLMVSWIEPNLICLLMFGIQHPPCWDCSLSFLAVAVWLPAILGKTGRKRMSVQAGCYEPTADEI